MEDIRRATVIELARANLIISAGVLNGSRGFTMLRKGRRLISEPPRGPNHTWMTREEFRARLAHYRATGLKPDAIIAFVMWGMKRRIRD